MSVLRIELENALSAKLPVEIVQSLIENYQYIKQQFFLGKYQPSELNAARFGECVLRLIEFSDTATYTDFGKQISSETIIKRAENNTSLPEGIRFLIPRLVRVLLDIRNKRNVAHVGGEVDSNYSDSLFVANCTDWILIEIVRNFHTNSIDEAKRIVDNINEVKVPVVSEIEGFIRIQNTDLDTMDKVLLVLYYKLPSKIIDKDIAIWLKYSNRSRFKNDILKKLDSQAYIHYYQNYCTLLPKGIYYVEKNINFNIVT